ncbi:DUF4402 domain-containing protein [Gillisia sp. Q332]|uniref:DUF4402 domain-containing protein n=1 Tax=Gillisia xinjiangensis TaxID=3384765 RepID=UPI00391C658F
MKKITFIFFALIAGTGFAQFTQESAEGTADVNAQIVSPIEITNGTALNFGSINGTATGGNVNVSTTGARTFDNPDMVITTATAITAAAFEITAALDYSYSISIPATSLTGTGVAMPITFINSLGSTDAAGLTQNVVGTGTTQNLNVGGVLTVGDGQTLGAYSGTVKVTVAYE